MFQSTHSLRSATNREEDGVCADCVSIHALLAECDKVFRALKDEQDSFNPRTPCGVRLPTVDEMAGIFKFQSTHSLRSATSCSKPFLTEPNSFNPRTPCGVRRMHRNALVLLIPVSIHALLAECDPRLRGRPGGCAVSIHALLAECDIIFEIVAIEKKFQSTHSLRSATKGCLSDIEQDVVSIHALLAECDCA